jgi:hypothetical protein
VHADVSIAVRASPSLLPAVGQQDRRAIRGVQHDNAVTGGSIGASAQQERNLLRRSLLM